MPKTSYLFLLLTSATLLCCNRGSSTYQIDQSVQTVLKVDSSLFLAGTQVSIVDCELANGEKTRCYEIVSSTPSDHEMGPWCPDHISDDDSAGGIWMEGGQVYDVDGAFIKNLAALYNDDHWAMYNEEGEIYTTDTRTDCANAANPNVGAEYENFCVECLPAYVSDLKQRYLLPVSPIKLTTPLSFSGHGPHGGFGPSVRGIAFNGIRFEAPAPTHAILGAYTLAPFDDAGGHINLFAGYHYHSATGVTTELAQSDGHAPMIGYAVDGHGLYAHLDVSGRATTNLDECRGHYDDIRGYHYHVDAAGANNFINCLHGAYAH